MSDNIELMRRFRAAATKFIEAVDSAPHLETEVFLANGIPGSILFSGSGSCCGRAMHRHFYVLGVVLVAGVLLRLRALAFVSMELGGGSVEAKSGQLGEYSRRPGSEQRSADSTVPGCETQNSGRLRLVGNELAVDCTRPPPH